MNTLIQQDSSKFISNAILAYPNVFVGDIDGRLYELYFRYKFHNILLTITEHISNEIRNFIIEFSNTTNIVLYHKNTAHIDNIQPFGMVKHIINHDDKLNISNQNIFRIPKWIINSHIFNNQSKSRNRRGGPFLRFNTLSVSLVCLVATFQVMNSFKNCL